MVLLVAASHQISDQSPHCFLSYSCWISCEPVHRAGTTLCRRESERERERNQFNFWVTTRRMRDDGNLLCSHSPYILYTMLYIYICMCYILCVIVIVCSVAEGWRCRTPHAACRMPPAVAPHMPAPASASATWFLVAIMECTIYTT